MVAISITKPNANFSCANRWECWLNDELKSTVKSAVKWNAGKCVRFWEKKQSDRKKPFNLDVIDLTPLYSWTGKKCTTITHFLFSIECGYFAAKT